MKFICILPESIGGRLTMNSLFIGFQKNGYAVKILDILDSSFESSLKEINLSEYHYIFSYDYTGIVINNKYNLNMPVISYFSDSIQSTLSGKSWNKHFLELKKKTNYTFCWDYYETNHLKKELQNLYYLPHSVDTDIYRQLNLDKQFDIMFAGRLSFPGRIDKIISIYENFSDVKFALFCFPDHFQKTLKSIDFKYQTFFKQSYKGFIDNEIDMAKAINQSKIVLNFTSQGKTNLNYRTFQTLACETYLLTDYRKELESLFEIEQEVTCYTNNKQFLYLLHRLLNHPGDYTYKLKNARKKIETYYNSKHAAENIVNTVIQKTI